MEMKRIAAYLSKNYIIYLFWATLGYLATISIFYIITFAFLKETSKFSVISPQVFIMIIFTIEISVQFSKMFTYLLSQSFSRRMIVKSSVFLQILFLFLGLLMCRGLEYVLNRFSNLLSPGIIHTIELTYGEGKNISPFGLSVLSFLIFTSLLFILMQGIIFLLAVMYPLTFNQKIILSVSIPALVGTVFLMWLTSKTYTEIPLKLFVFIFGGQGANSANPIYPLICLPLIAIGFSLLTYFILRKVDLNPSN